MTGRRPLHTPCPNGSTGPKTPEGKRICRFNAYRHGLLSKLRVFTPEERRAYEKHCKVFLEALAPVGDVERDIVQSIADNRWRLRRARVLEANALAFAQREAALDSTGHPDDDVAFAQAQAWRKEARNLQLLTLYEQRFQRACERNMAKLESLQSARRRGGQRGEAGHTPGDSAPKRKIRDEPILCQ